jgi:hypothetical protein
MHVLKQLFKALEKPSEKTKSWEGATATGTLGHFDDSGQFEDFYLVAGCTTGIFNSN